MDLEQRQIQSQKLILSPQLRQYLKLLQLPLMELKQAVEQELAENPVLEESPNPENNEVPLSSLSKEETRSTQEENVEELDFQNKISQLDQIDRDLKETLYSVEETSQDEIQDASQKKDYQNASLSKAPTLSDYLLWQLSFLELDARQSQVAQEIVGNINEDGYLKTDISEISQTRQVTPEYAEEVLKLVQSLDPPGIGARDLREALDIQLSKLEGNHHACAVKIVQDHFSLLERKNFPEIGKKLGVSEEAVQEAFRIISRLEPKPGRIFYSADPVAMIPDATISIDDDRPGSYKIEIHHESIPRLNINAEYKKMLQDKKLDPKTKAFLREKMTSALSLMRSLGQRKNTLRAITEEILEAQHDFFDKGFAYLRPLRLRDIAEKVKIHESTVSRAISGKYVVTPQGTIPYRNFFSSRMENEDGSAESQKSIMERIKRLIEKENKKKPLSDEKIVAALKTEGIKIARRTVAKYRDLLKILPTHLRKER